MGELLLGREMDSDILIKMFLNKITVKERQMWQGINEDGQEIEAPNSKEQIPGTKLVPFEACS